MYALLRVVRRTALLPPRSTRPQNPYILLSNMSWYCCSSCRASTKAQIALTSSSRAQVLGCWPPSAIHATADCPCETVCCPCASPYFLVAFHRVSCSEPCQQVGSDVPLLPLAVTQFSPRWFIRKWPPTFPPPFAPEFRRIDRFTHSQLRRQILYACNSGT